MAAVLRRRETVVWGALVLATVASFVVGTDHGLSGRDTKTAGTCAVLAVAFVKIHFIGMHFMELRRAPLALRLAFDGWVAGVGATVVFLYLAGR